MRVAVICLFVLVICICLQLSYSETGKKPDAASTVPVQSVSGKREETENDRKAPKKRIFGFIKNAFNRLFGRRRRRRQEQEQDGYE